MFRLLKQPYPFSGSWQHKLLVCFCIGLFIFLFLFTFRPFGLDDEPMPRILYATLIYGAITFVISSALQILVPYAFAGFFEESRWTVAKEVGYFALSVFFVALANIYATHIMYNRNFSMAFFKSMFLITTLVAVFPFTGLVLFKQIRLLKKYKAEASALQQKIEVPDLIPAKQVVAETISIQAENEKETLTLSPNDLLYISAADNYIRVYFQQNQEIKSQMLRGTLKKLEEVLAPHPQLYRCHRTYIVNLQKVKNISGNAQGYKLELEGVEEIIPVSRSLNKEIATRLGK